MLETVKHSLCAVVSATIAGMAIWTVLGLTGFVSIDPLANTALDILYWARDEVLPVIWLLRYIIIAALVLYISVVLLRIPEMDTKLGRQIPGLVKMTLCLVSVVVVGNCKMRQYSGEDPSLKVLLQDVLTPVGVAVLTALAVLFVKQCINCARKAGWID